MKLRGFISGAAQKPEAAVWRRRLLWGLLEEGVHAIIAAQDTDGDLGKLDGLKQVVALLDLLNPAQPVVIASPHRDAEAWLVAGFQATTPQEVERLATAQKALSFSPTKRPELLTAHPNDALQDAKRVCRFLLFGGASLQATPSKVLDPVAELPGACERCLSDLEGLQMVGKATLLVAFLEAIKQKLVPLFWGGSRAQKTQASSIGASPQPMGV